MFTTLKPAIIAAPFVLASVASAFAVTATPQTAPLPTERPALVAAAAPPVFAAPVAIGRTPQAVPESRRHVRVVGWKFLPDRRDAMVIAGRNDSAPALRVADQGVADQGKAERVTETASASALIEPVSAMASAE